MGNIGYNAPSPNLNLSLKNTKKELNQCNSHNNVINNKLDMCISDLNNCKKVCLKIVL